MINSTISFFVKLRYFSDYGSKSEYSRVNAVLLFESQFEVSIEVLSASRHGDIITPHCQIEYIQLIKKTSASDVTLIPESYFAKFPFGENTDFSSQLK